MNVEHQVGARIESQGHAVGLGIRRGSWLPEEEMAVGIKCFGLNFNFHSAEAGPRGRFLRASRLHAIHQNIGVMHHAFVARPYFDGFEPAGSIHWSAKNKIPILVSAAGGELIRLFRLDNQIRRPHLPAFCKFRSGREIGRRAFDGTLFHPMSDGSDLCVGESKLIRKFKFAGIGQPRRHESALRNGDDLPGMRFRIFIGKQREGA